MTQKQKVIFISTFIFAGFLVSVAYHIFCSYILKLNYYPYNTFLFRPEDRFGDFLDNFNAGANPYGEIKFSRAMFPFFMFLSRLMYLADHKIVLLGLYLAIFVYTLGVLIFNFLAPLPVRLRLLAVFSLLFCSYPVLISLDRANFENWIFLLIFFSIVLVQKKKYVLAGLLTGIAIAIKPYSAFFLPVLFIDGQVVAVLISMGIALLVTLLSLLALPVPLAVSISTLGANLGLYNEVYVVGNEGLYFGTSLFAVLKLVVFWLGDVFHWFLSSNDVLGSVRTMMLPYFLVTNVLFALILAMLCIYKTPLWKKTAVLAACLALFPYVGSSYRLLYFFVPLILFLVEAKSQRTDWLYSFVFGSLMIPTSYFHFVFNPIYLLHPGEADDSIFFHPIIIFALLILVIYDVLKQRELNRQFVGFVDWIQKMGKFQKREAE